MLSETKNPFQMAKESKPKGVSTCVAFGSQTLDRRTQVSEFTRKCLLSGRAEIVVKTVR
jgi:hypothetical protein